MEQKLDLQVAIPEFKKACKAFDKMDMKIYHQCIDIISEVCEHKNCDIIPVNGWQKYRGKYDKCQKYIKEHCKELCGAGGVVYLIQCYFDNNGKLTAVYLHHWQGKHEIIYGERYIICTKVHTEYLMQAANLLIKYRNSKY